MASVKWATKADLDEQGLEIPHRMIALVGRNDDSKIIGMLEQLDEHHKSIALELMRTLARITKKK